MKQFFSIFFLIASLSILFSKIFAEETGEETLLTYCQRTDLTADQLHTFEELKKVLEENDCEGLDKSSKDVTELYLYQGDIKDVSPLQFFTSLEKLDFGLNEISDFSPLQKLTSLRLLSLHTNKIRDISPSKNLTALNDINFSANKITDISILKNLTSLKGLDLSNNQIQDISPLKNLTSLKKLNLFNNQIKDLSPLKGLKFLKEFEISNNPIIKDPTHCPIDEGVPPEIRKFCTDYLSTLFGQTIRE